MRKHLCHWTVNQARFLKENYRIFEKKNYGLNILKILCGEQQLFETDFAITFK